MCVFASHLLRRGDRFRNDVIIIDGRSFRVDSSAAGRGSLPRFALLPQGAGGRDEAPPDVESETSSVGADEELDEGAAIESSGGSVSLSDGEESGPRDLAGPAGSRKRRRAQGAGARLGGAALSASLDKALAGELTLCAADDAGAATAVAAKRAAVLAAKSTQQRTGIGNVSVANDVRGTGGHFSAADSAPHMLRAKALGYAEAFSSSQLPLDRPWDGPRVRGATAYRVGTSGDLRVLWRQVCRRESVKAMCSTAASVAAASGVAWTAPAASGPRSLTAAIGSVVGALGGEAAFRDAPEFPPDHRLLRDALRRAGLADLNPVDARALTDSETVGGMRESSRASTRAKGRRVPNSRAFVVKGNTHLDPEQRRAMVLARLQVLKSQEDRASGVTG